jgi:Spy/CpxP family protein refolding chaperone
MKHNLQILALLAVVVFFIAAAPAHAQSNEQSPSPPNTQQNRFARDPVHQLNLTPEQREQIRAIRDQSKEERAAINQKVRDTNRALEEALDSDSPDQVLVEQRLQEVAAAQAAAMRMRISTEVKIRQVLTQEQRTILRTLRRHTHEIRRERRLHDPEERRKRREERTIRLREHRNRTGPLIPGPDSQATPRP